MNPYSIFLFGFIGGCAPEIIRIYKLVREDKLPEYKHPKLYIVVSGLMAALGGVIAIAFDSPTPVNAIWIGISTPTIISTFARSLPPNVA